jgi:hypothetical protein
MIKRFAAMGLICLAFMTAQQIVQAAPAVPAGAIPTGVTVSPVIQQIHLLPSQGATSFTVQVTNNTSHPVSVDLGSADFVANGQAGGLTFLTTQGVDPNILSHELASSLTTDPQHIELAPKVSQKVVVKLSGVEKLAPGGHYGAVIYHIVNEDAPKTINGNRISLQQAISTLVFASTEGQGTQGLRLLRPNLRGVTFHFPQSVNIIMLATGNTQVTPRGTLSVSTGSSKQAPTAIINSSSGLVLPGTNRLYQTTIPNGGISWWPRVYHVHVVYHYDSETTYHTYNTSFLYINIWHILLTIVSIAFIVWALSKLKRYYKYLRQKGKLRRVKNLPVTPSKPVADKLKTNRNIPKKIAVDSTISVIHSIEVNTTTSNSTIPKQKAKKSQAQTTKSGQKS